MKLRLILLLTFVLLTITKDERWLSVSEVSERFGIPIQTLYDWRRRRYGPRGVRMGRVVRVAESGCLRSGRSGCVLGRGRMPAPGGRNRVPRSGVSRACVGFPQL